MLKVIIIGCGRIAGGYDDHASPDDWPLSHAGAYTHHGGFEIIACVDPDIGKRELFQQKWNVPWGVSYPEELGDSDLTVDVVSICSPTELHSQHLKTVLRWGPNLVFCEKPLTHDLSETEHLIRCYESAGIPLVVNFTRRWAPDICSLKEHLKQAFWGQIYSVSAIYNKGILNSGSHMVDLISFLFGSLKILAVGRGVYDFWPDDPSVPALLETKERIPVALSISHAKHYALFELQIVTERGVLSMESGGMRWTKRLPMESQDFFGYRALGLRQLEFGRYKEAMAGAVENISSWLEERVELASIGSTALHAHQICHEIRDRAHCKESMGGN